MRVVFSNAQILVDDGVQGFVDSKGDGLKRAVTFAILRSYVTLSQKPGWGKGASEREPRERYIFLYEEPKLYLHLTSQMVLYESPPADIARAPGGAHNPFAAVSHPAG